MGNQRIGSLLVAFLLFAIALWSTARSYAGETDGGRKQQYLIQMVLAGFLVILFAVGMWYIS